MQKLTCATCDKPVSILKDGTKIRTCEHKDAPIKAHLVSTVYGQSSLRAK